MSISLTTDQPWTYRPVTNHVHTPTAILAFGSHRQRHAQKNKKLRHDITATVTLQRKDVLWGL